MTNMNATPKATVTETTPVRPNPMISGARWTSRRSSPRLISFGWAPVTSPGTRR